MFAGLEVHEIPSRNRDTTPPTRELTFLRNDFRLKGEKRRPIRPDDTVLALDDAASVRRIEDFADERRVGGDRLDAVHRLCQRQLGVFEPFEQL